MRANMVFKCKLVNNEVVRVLRFKQLKNEVIRGFKVTNESRMKLDKVLKFK